MLMRTWMIDQNLLLMALWALTWLLHNRFDPICGFYCTLSSIELYVSLIKIREVFLPRPLQLGMGVGGAAAGSPSPPRLKCIRLERTLIEKLFSALPVSRLESSAPIVPSIHPYILCINSLHLWRNLGVFYPRKERNYLLESFMNFSRHLRVRAGRFSWKLRVGGEQLL